MSASSDPSVGPSVSEPLPTGDWAAGRDTDRRIDTAVDTTATPGLQATGAFDPVTGTDDGSSATGGYTPADGPAEPTAVAAPGYQILGLLGRGGMGVVYKARQVALDRVVALKMILAGPHASAGVLARFQTEAQAVARLQHPNIVQIHEVGQAGGLPFFSLEFVAGGSLARKVAHEPQPPRYAAETVAALARAMQYAHEVGVVHRDLKPANVLLAADETPKVTDFGLAKRLERDSGQTQEGAVLGTPSYMAPEQARGDHDRVGPPADIYSLGAILYDLLTGRPPFAGSSVLNTLEMVCTREPVPPSQLAGKVPRDLETICLKCLHKDPARRYPTAGALADDLKRFLDGRPITARPVSAPERAWRWAKRNPWVAGLGTAVAVLLVAATTVTSVLSWRLFIKRQEAEANLIAANRARDDALAAQWKEEQAHKEQHKAHLMRNEQIEDSLLGIRDVVVFVDNQMRYRQSLLPARKEIFKIMIRQLEKVRDRSANTRMVNRTEAIIATRLGEVYFRDNRIEEAGTEIRKTRDTFARIVEANPSDLNARRNLAGITNQLADVELRLGNSAAARELYVEALRLRVQWWLTSFFHPDARLSIAQSLGLIGTTDLQMGDPEAAIGYFRAAIPEFDRLPPNYVRDPRVRRERATGVERLGECLWRTGDPAAAEQLFRTALQAREAHLIQKPDDAARNRDVALSRLTLGDLLVMRNEPGKAWAEYDAVYRTFAVAAKAEPDDLNARRDLAAVHYRLGVVAPQAFGGLGLGAHGLAARHFDECLRMRRELAGIDQADTQGQMELMLALARCGRIEEAETIANELRKRARDDRRVLFQVACGLSVAGTGKGPTADRCRDQAIQVLKLLVDRGWKDRVAFETEPDLEAARQDPGFRPLLDRLPGPTVSRGR